MVESGLPPRIQPFASLFNAQPPEVQEAFQFRLGTAMQESGKFELVSGLVVLAVVVTAIRTLLGK